MDRKTGSMPNGSSWQWRRTAETQKALLDAAGEVFAEHGFADASVAMVVERAESSVGSLYHHFGGKTELYMALWEAHQAEHEEHATGAVAKARASGEQDPLELFIVGSRMYLEDAWNRRNLETLFMDGDGPPGFEFVRRTRAREWIRQNGVLLGAGNEPEDRLSVAILSELIDEASREVATSATKREANRITDATVALIRKFGPPNPA